MEAIETQYKGLRFRSRTEARWAVFFDALGLFWRYEEEGYKLPSPGSPEPVLYLPDFWFPNLKLWVEIKGKEPDQYEARKARLLAKESGHPVLLLAGSPMHPRYTSRKAPPHLLYHPDGEVEEVFAHKPLGVRPRDVDLFTAYGEAAGARFEHGERPKARRLV